MQMLEGETQKHQQQPELLCKLNQMDPMRIDCDMEEDAGILVCKHMQRVHQGCGPCVVQLCILVYVSSPLG